MNVKPEPEWNPETSPSLWINHASRLLMRLFEQRLRPLNFSMTYMLVVMALKEGGALLQKDLAERARVEQPTMAVLLARMERDGLITREPHPTDKRAIRITLTRKSQSRIPTAKRALAEVVERMTAGFSQRERETFLSLLRRAVQNLDEVAREGAK
jgi:MarR family transcriptional regulator, transcriptional regulator for hemolysin